MNSDLDFLMSRTSKFSKEMYALNDSISVRRKQLEMKQLTQSASKTEYYRKEIERDRSAKESKQQNFKDELETKLERLKRDYDANVKEIKDKIEKKIDKINDDSDSFQKYCRQGMNQEINEDSDTIMVKLKEQLTISRQHYEKCKAAEDEAQASNLRFKKEEAMLRLKLEQEKHDRIEAEMLNKQRLAAIEREESIRKEVARCKAEKQKDREESVKVKQPQTNKKIQAVDDLRRVDSYAKAIYDDDLVLFNLLTFKEKIKLVKSQNLDKKVNEYQDQLKGKDLSDFLDESERNRYRKALGISVLEEQRQLIKSQSVNNQDLKEFIETSEKS